MGVIEFEYLREGIFARSVPPVFSTGSAWGWRDVFMSLCEHLCEPESSGWVISGRRAALHLSKSNISRLPCSLINVTLANSRLPQAALCLPLGDHIEWRWVPVALSLFVTSPQSRCVLELCPEDDGKGVSVSTQALRPTSLKGMGRVKKSRTSHCPRTAGVPKASF